MRSLVVLPAVLLCVGSGGPALAGEIVYLPTGDVVELAVRPAPLPPVQLGGFAIRLLDGPAPAPPPFVERGAAALPLMGEALGDPAKERVAAARVVRRFTVGDERDRLRLLRLRVRYQDAMVARLNDVEIARRNLDPGAGATALASRQRGAEWEIIPVPVVEGLLRPGENRLEIEVRPSSARLMPTIDVGLSGGFGPRIVRGPLIARVAADRATVVFETDLPTVGEVRLAGRIVHGRAELSTRHEIEIDDLPEGGEVRYQVAAAADGIEELGAESSFHTAPADGEPVRFVVYGDVRTGHETHAEILRAVEGEAPDFIVSTGDHVVRGTDEADWQRFFSLAGPLLARVPYYPVLGNHDLGVASGSERRFEDVFALPARPADCPPGASWYSFDFAGVHVVVLDSNALGDARQLAWLEADLTASSGARAVFAALHHGPFSRGPHGGLPIAAERYVPVLARHGVALLFSGHDHIYQRGEMSGLPYVVTGGGGAPLYPLKCGVPGRPACTIVDGAVASASVYHYVVVEVFRDDLRLCPRRPDGTAVEECVHLPLRRRAE